jgi:hypothetical protein
MLLTLSLAVDIIVKKHGNMVKNILNLFLFIVSLCVISCSVNEPDEINILFDQEFAVPLINSEISIGDVADQAGTNTSLSIDPDGKITVIYKGDFIRNQSTELFPPFPGLVPFPLTDSITAITLPIPDKFEIRRAIFGNTNIRFAFENNFAEFLTVRVWASELQKDGKPLDTTFLVAPVSVPVAIPTQPINLNGYEVTSFDNSLEFRYDARNLAGDRLVFDNASMFFDVLLFNYVEGYFSDEKFELKGNVIAVGVFNKWISGGMDFEAPRLTVDVQNSFGFPVRSRFNQVRFNTISGNAFDLNSEFIESGVDFGYPTINEVGVIKENTFSFTSQNSNIREIFNDKTIQVSYDIDAIANPDQDRSIINFVDTSSFFSIAASVEVPLLGKANNFTLSDTFDLDLTSLNDLNSAEFKSIFKNDFPVNIDIQFYFLSDQLQILDSMFVAGPIFVESAQIMPNGRTAKGLDQIFYTEFDVQKTNRIRLAKRIAAVVRLQSPSGNHSAWIYDDYAIGLKLGAKFRVRNK